MEWNYTFIALTRRLWKKNALNEKKKKRMEDFSLNKLFGSEGISSCPVYNLKGKKFC